MSKFSIGRREFTLGAAAVATAVLIPSSDVLAQTEQQASSPQDLQKPDFQKNAQQAQAALAKLTPQARAEVEMKINNIFRKYGNRLNDEQKADIRRAMAEGHDGLEKMRAFALDNGDQPATVYQPHGAPMRRRAQHGKKGTR
jgi:hypothetical protein